MASPAILTRCVRRRSRFRVVVLFSSPPVASTAAMPLPPNSAYRMASAGDLRGFERVQIESVMMGARPLELSGSPARTRSQTSGVSLPVCTRHLVPVQSSMAIGSPASRFSARRATMALKLWR